MTNTVTYPADQNVWVNSDGLIIRFGKGAQVDAIVGKATQYGTDQILTADFSYHNMPAHTADEAHGQFVGGYPNNFIPTGAFIVSATLQAMVGFTGTGATLSVGLVTRDGTEIDNDGFLDAVALTAIDGVGEVATGAGALVNTVLTTGGYLWWSVGTADYTAGKGIFQLTYRMPDTDANY